ncbi:MAG: nodulation protein NfeD, partial [Bacteroidota bacterium]
GSNPTLSAVSPLPCGAGRPIRRRNPPGAPPPGSASIVRPSPMKILRTLPLCFLLLAGGLPAGAGTPAVHVITVEASINPASADYIGQSIREAAAQGAECLVIRLNTPGGLLKSTRSIVSDLLRAPLPVIVYVSPQGAQSASAGAFITLAAHIAAMAPGTNIGAAHPVGMQGSEPDSIMNEKATNDAAAFIRSISEKRNRNVRWAEDAVRRSISFTETEALRDTVIDLVATDLRDLLNQADGRIVTVQEKERRLRTKGAALTVKEMDWKHRLLDVLSDPSIAYIFFLLGVYGLLFELYNPGSILPGVVGFICLVLAFYSLHTLPINYAGLALLLFGIILFIAEIKVTSYGLLSVGGVISLVLGSIMLIDTESPLEVISISWSVIIPAALCTALFFAFAIGMGIRAQRRRPATGAEGMVGGEGEALGDLHPEGQVRVRGEIWKAVSLDGRIRAGARIRVERIQDLTLFVRRVVS